MQKFPKSSWLQFCLGKFSNIHIKLKIQLKDCIHFFLLQFHHKMEIAKWTKEANEHVAKVLVKMQHLVANSYIELKKYSYFTTAK